MGIRFAWLACVWGVASCRPATPHESLSQRPAPAASSPVVPVQLYLANATDEALFEFDFRPAGTTLNPNIRSLIETKGDIGVLGVRKDGKVIDELTGKTLVGGCFYAVTEEQTGSVLLMATETRSQILFERVKENATVSLSGAGYVCFGNGKFIMAHDGSIPSFDDAMTLSALLKHLMLVPVEEEGANLTAVSIKSFFKSLRSGIADVKTRFSSKMREASINRQWEQFMVILSDEPADYARHVQELRKLDEVGGVQAIRTFREEERAIRLANVANYRNQDSTSHIQLSEFPSNPDGSLRVNFEKFEIIWTEQPNGEGFWQYFKKPQTMAKP